MNNKIFEKFRVLIYDSIGINYNENKKILMESRIKKLMTRYSTESFEEFYDMIFDDKALMTEFLNEMTTNKTNFFREINHFNFIKNEINSIMSANKRINLNKEIRVWSAGCSTGEEPYTIAMVLKELMQDRIKIKVLATDISTEVLNKALKKTYPFSTALDIPPIYLTKYFYKSKEGYVVSDEISDMITFRQFNFLNKFPFKNSFDIIFCRNVMIYFDAKTREELTDKFYKVLVKNGIMIIGHSESLTDNKKRFKYLKPTIYQAL